MSKLIAVVSLFCVSVFVYAGEAAHVVFVAGDTRIGHTQVVLGAVVKEGDEVSTGSDGYVYLKTIDNGFLILRPSSRARIITYSVDPQNPANTRIKLALLSGVARNISGEAVKHARQNFRFNTPVAAIGVRGTDFTVYTDQDTSRVAVISGGVVVSGFSHGCGSDGNGPCEGGASRELFAHQMGQLLQVRKGQTTPQLLPLGSNSPDVAAPPRGDEPPAKMSSSNSITSILAGTEISLDPHKNTSLIARIAAVSPHQAPVTGTGGDLLAEQPQRQIIWGRWQAVADSAASLDVVKSIDINKAQLLALNTYFAVLRSSGVEWRAPDTGNFSFALKQSEAYILNESTRKMTSANLENGKLSVDFDKSRFTTSFDLLSQQNERFAMRAQGDISRDGQLLGDSQLKVPTNMAVQGAIGASNGVEAAYIFQGRLDSQRVGTGVTYWQK